VQLVPQGLVLRLASRHEPRDRRADLLPTVRCHRGMTDPATTGLLGSAANSRRAQLLQLVVVAGEGLPLGWLRTYYHKLLLSSATSRSFARRLACWRGRRAKEKLIFDVVEEFTALSDTEAVNYF
jgi:hypothetical protein